MALDLGSRLKRALNVFLTKDSLEWSYRDGGGYSYRPDRPPLSFGNERASIVNAIFNRIAMDVAAIDVMHVRLDEDRRYEDEILDSLDNCLTLDANIDQTGRELMQNVVLTMFNEGTAAVVPVDRDDKTNEILTLRVGKVVEWHPLFVRVSLYNDRSGRIEEVNVPKETTVIVTNPFYSVVNESNSTLKRLLRKLSLMDQMDEKIGSNKMDMLIQLPYTVKNESKQKQAEMRRKDLTAQLEGNQYGIGYIDINERVIQLNRPVENTFVSQVGDLTNQLYGQLGMTAEIMNGTADETTMENYYTRTIEPIISAITDEMTRKFLTKTARTQGQSIMFFRDPFKLMAPSKIADAADKFTRNEIMSSNEFRQIVGRKPSKDPSADELRNKNLNQSNESKSNPPNADSESNDSKMQSDSDALQKAFEELFRKRNSKEGGKNQNGSESKETES